MRGVKMLVIAGLMVGLLGAIANPVADSAAAKANTCSVQAVGTKNSTSANDSKFTINGNMITGTFKVTGKNCTAAVSMIAWKLPNGKVRPYSEQTMFGYTQGTFKPGTHKLSVKLPNCSYQVDMVKGTKITGKNDGPRYFDRNLGWAIETGKKCKKPPVVVTHVTKVPKEVVVQRKVVTEEVPAELPKTGPALLSSVLGVPALAASSTYYWRSRRMK